MCRSASLTLNYKNSPRISSGASGERLGRDTLDSSLLFLLLLRGRFLVIFLIPFENTGWGEGSLRWPPAGNTINN